MTPARPPNIHKPAIIIHPTPPINLDPVPINQLNTKNEISPHLRTTSTNSTPHSLRLKPKHHIIR